MNFNQCIEHISLFKPCLFTSDTWASYENLGAIQFFKMSCKVLQ
jgi:hypothetical protein